MNSGDVHRKVVENPDNYEAMVKKLKDREKEQMTGAMERTGARTLEDLKRISKEAIKTRSSRTPYKSLANRTIQVEATSADVNELREKLDNEITEVTQRALDVMREHPSLRGKLQGRIKRGEAPPAA